jgi:ankyrin repeat protein
MTPTVFPTVFEVIRACTTALDIKLSSKKALDDLARNVHADYRAADEWINGEIQARLTQITGPQTASHLCLALSQTLDDYRSLVGSQSCDGLIRSQLMPLLHASFFGKIAAITLTELFESWGPDPRHLLSHPNGAVPMALQWLGTQVPEWPGLHALLDTDIRRRLSAWGNGVNLPSSFQITHLFTDKTIANNDDLHNRIRGLLLIARAIDHERQFETAFSLGQAVNRALCEPHKQLLLANAVLACQDIFATQLAPINNPLAIIKQQLMPSVKKTTLGKLNTQLALADIKSFFTDQEHVTLWGFYHWQQARWYVYNGDLDLANDHYKKTLNCGLYQLGAELEAIIKEGLVVAARQPRPDKAFLRQLYNALIQFKYDLPMPAETSLSEQKSLKASFKSTVEDWMIDHWRGMFKEQFPDTRLFEGVTYPATNKDAGALILIDDLKINLKKPNQRIKRGTGYRKAMPQIIWAVAERNYGALDQLLSIGADINQLSDAGDSALLIAIEQLNLTNAFFKSDRRCYERLASITHLPETLNRLTDKKRLLPLVSAVESGQPDIVKTLLTMGADPNQKGNTDLQSPLYICLGMMHKLNNPQAMMAGIKQDPTTPDALDAIRRNMPGKAGITLSDVAQNVERHRNDPLNRECQEVLFERVNENIQTHLTHENLQRIARLLLEHGADPNCPHDSPLKGYTPMMLAAEIDEAYIFSLMLIDKGDPTLSFEHAMFKRPINSFEVAVLHKSHKTLQLFQGSLAH